MRRRRELLLLVVLLGAPAVLAAIRHAQETESSALLRRVAEGHARASYRGGASWNARGPGKRVTVRHDAVSGRTAYGFPGPFFREFVLAGPSHRMPDPVAWCVDTNALLENYTATELEPRTFLERPVRVLRVSPRHAGRPTVEVWVDESSGLPLRYSTFRADGSLYRVCEFYRIEYGPERVPAVDLQKSHRYAGTPVSLDVPQAAAGFRPMFPAYLPAGFRLVEARVKQWATPKLTLVYSDGVTAFEIKQCPRATPAVLEDYYEEHRPAGWGKKGWGSSRDEREGRSGSPERAGGRSQPPSDSFADGGLSSWTRRMMSWHMRRARERLVRAEGEGAATVVCREKGHHVSHDLHVEDLDLTLMARGDLDTGEVLKVLRSLRR